MGSGKNIELDICVNPMQMDLGRFHLVNIYKGCYRSHDLVNSSYECQGVYWNLFELSPYKGLWVRYRTLFSYKPDPMPSFFRHTLRSRIQNLNLFWGPQKFLGASEAGKKNSHNSTIFWAKNKIRMNFLWDKLFDFLLFNEVLKNLIFLTY